MLAATNTLYMPLVMGDPSPPRFGVQVDGELSIPVIPGRIYQSPARWQAVDAWLGANMRAFGSERTIIGTKTCPPEYRLWPEKQGSPPRKEYYPEYAKWVYEIACQYRPWAMEIWNEPDAPTYIDNDLQYWFGAWVDEAGARAAGQNYGNLLSVVYPLLNGQGVKVIGGAMTGPSVEFLQGFLETGRCDYISYHVYPREKWDFTRVVYENCINQVRHYTDLPQIITETSIITLDGPDESNQNTDTSSLRARQEEYCEWLIEQSKDPEFPIWLWYSSDNNWRNCGLKRYGEYTPVYDVWKDG